ncbi:MAG: sulfite exporter TauE/SafE family protein [Alphaproteobacteria bacterium]
MFAFPCNDADDWTKKQAAPFPTSMDDSPLDFSQFGSIALVVGTAVFFAGGAVKGVLGLGLPLVAVPILASAMDPKIAVAMMSVPVLTSNIWLVFKGGRFVATIARFWPLTLALGVFTLLSAQLFVEIDTATASLILGLAVTAFCVLQVFPITMTVSKSAERWLNPGVGALSGLMGGISNFFGPPLFAYLVALRLQKDAFVAAVTLFFIVGGVPLYGSLAWHGVLTLKVLFASTIATIVVMLGVAFGTRLRRVVQQRTFERILIGVLFLIGLNLMRRGLA